MDNDAGIEKIINFREIIETQRGTYVQCEILGPIVVALMQIIYDSVAFNMVMPDSVSQSLGGVMVYSIGFKDWESASSGPPSQEEVQWAFLTQSHSVRPRYFQ